MKMKTIVSIGLIALLASCSTSNNVVSNRSIQKRKYNDGYYFSFNKLKNKKGTEEITYDLNSYNDEITENIPQNVSDPLKDNSIEKIVIEEEDNYAEFNDIIEENDESEKPDAKSSIIKKRAFIIPLVNNKNVLNQPEKLKNSNQINEKNNSSSGDDMFILLVILCFFLPWLSVGLYTDWDVMLTIVALLLWFLFLLPGIIFGLLVLFDVIG